MPWSARSEEPIPPPNGGELVTLKDAGTYITKLPKAEHDAPEWQTAMEALILVAFTNSWHPPCQARQREPAEP